MTPPFSVMSPSGDARMWAFFSKNKDLIKGGVFYTSVSLR
jgi:hypothetical protein